MVDVQDVARKLDEAPRRRSSGCPISRVQLQDALTKANRLIGSVDKGYGDKSKFHRDLDRLMPQLTDTARSIRALDRPAGAPSRGPDQGPHQHRQGMTTMNLGRRRLGCSRPARRSRLPASRPAAPRPIPVLYTLAVRPGPALPRGPRVVQLRDIGLPSYLDRKEIVRSSEDYKLGVMANDWWGEPLGSMLGRVLVVELSQRLPNSKIYSESGAITADPNAVRRRSTSSASMPTRLAPSILLAQAAVEFNRPEPLGGAQLRASPSRLPTPERRGPGRRDQRRRGRARRRDRGAPAALDAARQSPRTCRAR